MHYLVARRPEWKNGVICPRCGSSTVGFLKNQLRWQCSIRHPRRPIFGQGWTIFEDSPLGLDKWLPAMWLILNCKNGISSCEVAKALRVTQENRVVHAAIVSDSPNKEKHGGKLSGEVEVDETFIGGKSRNMHKSNVKRVITGTGGKDKP